MIPKITSASASGPAAFPPTWDATGRTVSAADPRLGCGDTHAYRRRGNGTARNGGTGADGIEHRAPPDEGRTRLRRLRHQRRRGQGPGRRGRHRRRLAEGDGREARRAALGLGDGPRRRDHRELRARGRRRPREGRRDHRRRQLPLPRRHPPLDRVRRARDRLPRRGHQRRRLGPGARLLPDDRGARQGGQATRSRSSPRSLPASATSTAPPVARGSPPPPSRATTTAAPRVPATS